METPRLAVLILVLLFLLWSPGRPRPALSRDRDLEEAVREERQSLSVLEHSIYGALDVTSNHWLNLTGLKQHDEYAWYLLPEVQNRAKQLLEFSMNEAVNLNVHNISIFRDDLAPAEHMG